MQVGVKTRNNQNSFLEYFADKADFYEVIADQKKGINFFRGMKTLPLPFVIHAEHYSQAGINYADKSKHNLNLESVNFARKVADELNSEKIIIHGGVLSHPKRVEPNDPNISIDYSTDFFKKLADKRILVENLGRFCLEETKDTSHLGYNSELPGFYNLSCATPKETKDFMKKAGVGFCFDISHQIFTAMYLGKDYLHYMQEFLSLHPSHYHLSGQKVIESSPRIVKKVERDHVCLADSNLDLLGFLNKIPYNAQITLETEPDKAKVEEDIKIIRKISRMIQK